MAVADVDGDELLDLYVNHHTLSPGEFVSAFATRHAEHEFIESRDRRASNDQHGATFFDIDQDGDIDLLEARGGSRGGASDPANEKTWNELYMNVRGDLVVDSGAAKGYGIEYGPARRRVIAPINVDGRHLALFFGSEAKDAGTYPSKWMRATSGGTFVDWDPLRGDLGGELYGVGAHLGSNKRVDMVTADLHEVTVQLDVRGGVERDGIVRKSFGDNEVGDLLVSDFDDDREQELFVGLGGPGGAADRLFELGEDNDLHSLSREAGLFKEKFRT